MSARDKERLVERGMTSEEAERVLERAARLQAERDDDGRLSRADVKAGAAEVGIDPSLVDEAARQLEREQRATEAERAAARVRRRTIARASAAGAVSVIAVVMVAALIAHGKLNDRLADVEKHRAQLDNVIARRHALVGELLALARAATAQSPAAKARALEQTLARVSEGPLEERLAAEAEIAGAVGELQRALASSAAPQQETLLVRIADEMAGAHNRIAVERKRYDEAVAEYNRVARSIPLRWLTTAEPLPGGR